MSTVRLERHLETSLCQYPELIDDSLWGICEGMEVVNPDGPFLKRQDSMPNGRFADMVFVEETRVTVVELKKVPLSANTGAGDEDVVDQVCDYLDQCKEKYPGRSEYRGYIVGTGIRDRTCLMEKISTARDPIRPLVFGQDIPRVISMCRCCGRGVKCSSSTCLCGATP
ncbi:hypothetical protein ACFL2Q_09400 [Thermodesulfobacteriota bacterium]